MLKRSGSLSEAQYRWLATQLPEPHPKRGPKPLPNEELLGGILHVLKTGCRWQDIPSEVCTHGPSSCWRRLTYWRKRGAVVDTWQAVLRLLDQEGILDLTLGHVDGSLVQSPAFKDGTGYSGKHHRTGTNVALTTDRNGLPLASLSTKGNRHDLHVAERVVKRIRVGAKHRRKRGRKPSYDKAKGKIRSFVERTIAWLKYFRKLTRQRVRGVF